MSNELGIGAPKGGRVHWLLWNLSGEFKRHYILKYDYAYHQYIFYRLKKRKLYDCFVIKRSSKKYFRAVYVNVFRNKVEFFGDKKSLKIADRMYEIYREDKENEKKY